METTVVTEPASTRVLLWIGLPVGCAVLAWLLRLLAGWLVTWPHMLWRGPLEAIDSIPAPWDTLGPLGVGLVVGLLLAAVVEHETLTATVADDAVTLESMDRTTTFPRSDVTSVFLDRKHLVLLGRDTGELDRRPCELDRDRVAEAFRAHDYPWADADPYAQDYRRWVPDLPGLPDGAHALLTARQKSLRRKDSTDAAELRGELARLGVLVRDEKDRQYWRLVDRS